MGWDLSVFSLKMVGSHPIKIISHKIEFVSHDIFYVLTHSFTLCCCRLAIKPPRYIPYNTTQPKLVSYPTIQHNQRWNNTITTILLKYIWITLLLNTTKFSIYQSQHNPKNNVTGCYRPVTTWYRLSPAWYHLLPACYRMSPVCYRMLPPVTSKPRLPASRGS